MALLSHAGSFVDSSRNIVEKYLTPLAGGFPSGFSRCAETRTGMSCGWQFSNHAISSTLKRTGSVFRFRNFSRSGCMVFDVIAAEGVPDENPPDGHLADSCIGQQHQSVAGIRFDCPPYPLRVSLAQSIRIVASRGVQPQPGQSRLRKMGQLRT